LAVTFFLSVAPRPVFRALRGGDPAWQSFPRATFARSGFAKADRRRGHLAVATASGEADARSQL
jgi:hypothetical protein